MLGPPDNERQVQSVGAKLHHRIAGYAFGDFDLDAGIAIFWDQLGEEAERDQGRDADTQTATFG